MVDLLAHGEGAALPLDVAGVELLNVVRPTVAVAWLGAFAGHALAAHPNHDMDLSADDSAPERRSFVHEVRRFYPFVPALAGTLRRPAHHLGAHLRPGDRLVLDVPGTNRHPESLGAARAVRPGALPDPPARSVRLRPPGRRRRDDRSPLPGRGHHVGAAGGDGPAAGLGAVHRRPAPGAAGADPCPAGRSACPCATCGWSAGGRAPERGRPPAPQVLDAGGLTTENGAPPSVGAPVGYHDRGKHEPRDEVADRLSGRGGRARAPSAPGRSRGRRPGRGAPGRPSAPGSVGSPSVPASPSAPLVEDRTGARPHGLHLADEDAGTGRPDPRHVGDRGAQVVEARRVLGPQACAGRRRTRRARGRPPPRAWSRCSRRSGGSRRGRARRPGAARWRRGPARASARPSRNSSRAVSTAMSAEIRAELSRVSTSSWNSGIGLSRSVMPAATAYVVPWRSSRSRTVSRCVTAPACPCAPT